VGPRLKHAAAPSESSVDALFARAALAATAEEQWIPDDAPSHGLPRTMKVGSDVVQYGIALTEQLAAEFRPTARGAEATHSAHADAASPQVRSPATQTLIEGPEADRSGVVSRMD
jgi:hypothetical protein